jgi:hypothetical protein
MYLAGTADAADRRSNFYAIFNAVQAQKLMVLKSLILTS